MVKQPKQQLIATEKRILTPSGRLQQVAALVHRRQKGVLQFLLITSRGSGRWVLPKGWPQVGRTLAETALCEAYEEAGVRGKISPEPIGSFNYSKADLPLERINQFSVAVFEMEFTGQEKNWPEKKERVCKWVSPQEAVRRVEEPDLKGILQRYGIPDIVVAAE